MKRQKVFTKLNRYLCNFILVPVFVFLAHSGAYSSDFAIGYNTDCFIGRMYWNSSQLHTDLLVNYSYYEKKDNERGTSEVINRFKIGINPLNLNVFKNEYGTIDLGFTVFAEFSDQKDAYIPTYSVILNIPQLGLTIPGMENIILLFNLGLIYRGNDEGLLEENKIELLDFKESVGFLIKL
ncbi:MAG: hypothetical protein JXR81_03465 [Candidatus Goldbacteria bacterium]|nr:hypothetical protein [Candidatus Goldiibacteriota bacterium]